MYRRALALKPDLEEPYLRLAQVYAEWGKYAEAEALLVEASGVYPEKPSFALLLGEVYSRQGFFDRAVACCVRFRESRLPEVHFSLGIAYLHLGTWIEAEKEFRIVLHLESRFPGAREGLGEALINRKQYREAAEELRAGIRQNPYSASGHRLLGIALLHMYQLERAFDEFVLAVDMDPQDAEAWRLCGDTLLRMRRFVEAEPYLEKALALNPSSPDASASFGFLCLQKGDTTGALHAFDTALKIQPGHQRALDGKLRLKISRKHLA